jgi:hypothetical protein
MLAELFKILVSTEGAFCLTASGTASGSAVVLYAK